MEGFVQLLEIQELEAISRQVKAAVHSLKQVPSETLYNPVLHRQRYIYIKRYKIDG